MQRRSAWGLAVLGLAAAVLAGSGSARADGSDAASGLSAASHAGRVAFWKGAGQRWELYLAGPGASEARLVYRSSFSPVETCVGRTLDWSPDGSALLSCAPVAGERGASRLFMVRQDG